MIFAAVYEPAATVVLANAIVTGAEPLKLVPDSPVPIVNALVVVPELPPPPPPVPETCVHVPGEPAVVHIHILPVRSTTTSPTRYVPPSGAPLAIPPTNLAPALTSELMPVRDR